MNHVDRNSRCLILVVIFAILYVIPIHAKRKDDVVVLKNGDRLTGEIKDLQRGELRFKSSYMAEAVRLDWARVERLESKDRYLIYLTNGDLYTGFLRLTPASDTFHDNVLISADRNPFQVKQIEVLRLVPSEAGVLRQLEGSIDLGLSYTSSNDQYQAELAAAATYRQGDHSVTASIDSAFSGQAEGSSSNRNQFTLDYRKQLSSALYIGGLLELLHSDQQSLNLRTTGAVLVGRNIRQTERTRFSLFGGLAGTRERYSPSLSQPRTTNADATVGFDLVMFRFKTTDIRSRFSLYPSLTTPGRMRMQAKSDLRIEVLRNVFWGFHLYEDFDSKPPIGADKNDLGVSTSLGWKF